MPPITGTPGNDTLTGTAGNDEMYGLDGYDIFIESPGDDLIDGGAGFDTVQYDNNAPPENITVDFRTGIVTGAVTGTDTLRNIESISTGSGDDVFTGSDGSDSLDAGTGHNTINAGAGDDFIGDSGVGSFIDGGAGDDSLSLTRPSTPASPFSLTFTPGATITLADGTTIQNIEHLTLFTSGTGNDVVTFIHPQGSNEWQDASGNDTAIIDVSDVAQDFMLFRARSSGFASLTTVRRFTGSIDKDPYVVLNGIESIHLLTGSGNDRLDGGEFDDIFDGGAGNDILLGNGGDDILRGGSGANILDGGAGADTAAFSGARANYSITPNGDGSVTVSAGSETDILTNIEFLQFSDQTVASPLTGGTPKITISGTLGGDRIYGTSAGETILGQDGDDWLTGEEGDDILRGGNGNDTAYILGDNAYINLAAGTSSSAFDGNDTLIDIESIWASGANVTVIGDDSANTLRLSSFLGGTNLLDGRAGNDSLFGYGGNDKLRGGTGINHLDGGDDTDTAAYARAPGSYLVMLNGDGSYTVKAPDLTDTLINIEQASFDGTGQTLSMAAFASQSFNPLRYVASYSDLIGVFGLNQEAAANHYLSQGYYEGRTASFDALDYTASYGDLIRAFGLNQTAALTHYIQNGYAEGRRASFNALAYTASYGDLIQAFGTNQSAALTHYIQNGYAEGRTVSFNALAYTASYGDLIQAFGTNQTAALNHYVSQGFQEGRTASFNALAYTASYGDLIRAFGTNQTVALTHYIQNGYAEGRTVRFDPMAYLLTNTDLQTAGFTAQTATIHYIQNGYSEGRSASGAFGTEQTQHILTLGTQAASSLTSGDEDWFSINLTAGHAYDFSLSGLSGGVTGGLSDPYLELHDAHGVLIAQDNDSGPGTDALIHVSATATGTYYLVASSNTPGATGNYNILAANG